MDANHVFDEDYHFVYKTSCPNSGKFYIGVHSTNNLDDGYVGTGLWPRRYKQQHGKGILVREILEFFPTRIQADNRERSIISMVRGVDPLCMNFATGGYGHSKESAKAWRDKRRQELGGCSKETDPAMAKVSIALTGRTKETHPYISLAAIKSGDARRGRTKETDHGVARMAESLRGRTKETHPGVARQAAAIRGKSFPSQQVICPHCSKQGAQRGMTRWHFDKCRAKKL